MQPSSRTAFLALPWRSTSAGNVLGNLVEWLRAGWKPPTKVRGIVHLTIWLLIAGVPNPMAQGAEVLRVMTFNLWHGGEAGGQPLSQTAAVIQLAKADVVGLQETYGRTKQGSQPDNGKKLAELLGWFYFDQGERTGILSRFPIATNTPHKWGVSVRLPSGRTFWMFNAHFSHAPYQPYQLLKIPYANAPFIETAEEAVNAARQARGHQVTGLLKDLRPMLSSGATVFLTGDFNEPSHLDWTPRAAAAGVCPIAVDYPSTRVVMDAGLRDVFRTVHPDEIQRRGNTWTPTTTPDDPKDRHDRIDFVFFSGTGVTVKLCDIVGESKAYADLVLTPYPSDHRAVVATVQLPDSR
ncbi:MAG: endonuclease/exonuclease/phosphatase family protein [Verrucomicrobiales bacterium]|nr:endonuclease/exonuclease/phosphatase family protein [Verrucomicrobiales bacterium]